MLSEDFVKSVIRAGRVHRMANSPQLTLGELIGRLEQIPPTFTNHRSVVETKRVWFDFGRTYPEQLASWRGSYAELSITFDYEGRITHQCGRPWTDPEYMPADRFLAMLRAAVGQTFQGYKGGDFTMAEDTPVWVANYGDTGNTGIVGVSDMGYEIVIETAWCEF